MKKCSDKVSKVVVCDETKVEEKVKSEVGKICSINVSQVNKEVSQLNEEVTQVSEEVSQVVKKRNNDEVVGEKFIKKTNKVRKK